ncbi:MAG: hypothetical protein LBQ84_01750, partial [Flavobacteriaceae bacterium]|nr:hypothetical protein [Flavobacteriaceae bacterium]
MMKMFLIMLISCLVFSCSNANEKNNSSSDTIQQNSITDTRIEDIKQAFEQKDYTKFFKLFPDTYSELVDFYGFDDITGEKPLYGLYVAHINYLF